MISITQRSFLFCLLFHFFSLTVNGGNDLKSLSDYLDHIINNKEQFSEVKEQRINSLKNLLSQKHSSPEYYYEINRKIYNEYKKYKLDSAIYYAVENVKVAKELNIQYLKYMSDIDLASVYSYSGKILESEKILSKIDSRQLPKDLLEEYYETYSRFYGHYAVFGNQNRYYAQVELYRDSLLDILETTSYKYRINMAYKYIISRRIDEAEELLYVLLDTENADTPQYALITNYLGVINGMKGLSEPEMRYYTMSAIADIKNAIKENASCQRLARIYYKNGNLSKAFQYSQSAIEDAIFSGVQFRTTQMAEFYSIINASYQMKEAKSNKKLKKILILISILSLFLILLVLFIYQQIRKLDKIKEELSRANCRLVELNKELNEVNDMLKDKNMQLIDSSHIKEQYIAQFFNLCSAYIDKMEDYRRAMYKLAINKKYEELVKKLRSTTVIENEQEELFKRFDTIFLNLYPTFVADFNSLLIEEERIILKSDDLLNKELRIYALLRLGITDSVKIAAFLRCSMSTVYNYRTKIRNKAVISKDDFENRIMKIGVSDQKGN